MSDPSKNPGHKSTKADHQDIRHILPAYVGRLPSHVRHMRRLHAEGNNAELRIMAHQLKGSGKSFGFEPISTLAAALEDQLLAGRTCAEVTPAMETLIAYMEGVEGYPGT